MAEPQPKTIKEGDQAPESIPNSTASQTAALSALDTPQASNNSSTQTTDPTALGDAMKNLNVSGGTGGAADGTKNVKVEVGDVNLLVEYLDISKARATELLKANEADAVKAMRAWVSA